MLIVDYYFFFNPLVMRSTTPILHSSRFLTFRCSSSKVLSFMYHFEFVLHTRVSMQSCSALSFYSFYTQFFRCLGVCSLIVSPNNQKIGVTQIFHNSTSTYRKSSDTVNRITHVLYVRIEQIDNILILNVPIYF